MDGVVLDSVITCPHCGFTRREEIEPRKASER
jgi:hypothetical protein